MHSMLQRLPFFNLPIGLCLVVSFVTPACGSGNDDALERPGAAECVYEQEPIAWDEVSPSGIVANDLLAFAEGLHELSGEVVYHDGETDILVELHRRGDHAVHHHNVEGACEHYFEIPVTLTLGLETYSGNLEPGATANQDGTSLGILVKLDPEDLHDDLTLDQLSEMVDAPENSEVLGLFLDVTFTAEVISGELSVSIQTFHGEGPDGAVSETRHRIEMW